MTDVFAQLSKEQFAFISEALTKTNKCLKKWHQQNLNMSFKKFRHAVFTGRLSCRYSEYQNDLPLIMACKKPCSLLDGKSVEQVILQSFEKMITKLSRKALKSTQGHGLEDLIQECYLKLIDAVYAWNPEKNVKLSTYFWTVIKRHMFDVCRKSHLTQSLTNQDMQLKIQWQQQVAKHPTKTFDENVQELGLNNKQIKRLNQILPKVFTHSELELDTEKACDYTELRANYKEAVDDVCDIKKSVNELLSKADLTTIERELIQSFMQSTQGWQTKFAQSKINPRTNKPYSRMRITQILQQAKQKLAEVA